MGSVPPRQSVDAGVGILIHTTAEWNAELRSILRSGHETGHVRGKSPLAKEFYGVDLSVIAAAPKRKQTTREKITIAKMNLRKLEKRLAREQAYKPISFIGAGRGNNFRRRCRLLQWQELIVRMAPGAWYAVSDLIALMPEYAPMGVTSSVARNLLACSLVERVDNPDYVKTTVIRKAGEALYLYRLSRRGEEMRGELIEQKLARP